ncbi:probable glutamate--tRNA ligase, mitochondrial [Drosophila hydei]|uniref:Nondiscriminating glutamyl-tRNA synthetase EARS2, mitochondrial n=1 Tax=Drosophila hydei TaxID=7224 RepID=A0A6J2SUR0_DROHY|nr:probable glutamate--tRNA ligase, mitochondrial [Drosophila hydei]
MFSLRYAKVLRQCLHTTHRLCHSEVRVRFAPSPTGYLHLGGLRTALYNYLFVRHSGGKFLLRIEDTDQTRLVPGATERLIEDLLWAGIEIDEGPGFDGAYGPYIQSQRRELYSQAVERLLENGSAYRCFCTERRLDLLRKDALRTRQVPRYDNKCRHLTAEQLQQQLDKGTPYCIRFKLTSHEEPLQDLIYGSVQHNVSETEGDPVIMKSDLYPTYHLANVVDDHLMGITHVLRGVEWQISTTKHLLLYKAFDWQPPQFGHLPLLVNADGSKLSKRQGDIGIKQFRDRGYFPTALLNYIISAGGGFEHRSHSKPQLYSMDNLAKQFLLERVNAHPSRLNAELLNDYNQLELKAHLADPLKCQKLVSHVQQLIRQAYPDHSHLDLAESHIEAVLHWSAQRLTLLQDLTSSKLSFLWVKPSHVVLNDLNATQWEELLQQLQAQPSFHKDQLNELLRSYAKAASIKFPALMKTLRGALSGLQEGPGVAEMMEILGKDVVLQRLQESLDKQKQLQLQQ